MPSKEKKLITAIFLIISCSFIFYAGSALCSREEIYKDPGGRFAIELSPEWTQKNFPAQGGWQRVSFQHPTKNDVNVLVIYGPVSRNYTIETLLQENQRKIRKFKQQFPSGTFTIRQDHIADMDVLVFDMNIASRLRQRILTTLCSQTLYSLTFKAKNQQQFQENEQSFNSIFDSFIPLKTGTNYSDADITEAIVDRYRILAELSVTLHDTEAALFYVKKGLEISPTNIALLHINKSLN